MIAKINNLTSSLGKNSYLSDVVWLGFEKILRLFAGFFVGVWVARYLGAEQFGLFSYVQSLVALFAAIATLGLDSIVVKALVKSKRKRDLLLGTAFVLKLIGATIILLSLAVVMYFQSGDYETNIMVFFVASSAVFQSFNVLDFYFQSAVLNKFVARSRMLVLLLSSLLKIALIICNAPLVLFAVAVLFDSFIFSLTLVYFYWGRGFSLFSWRVDIGLAKKLLSESWPLILSGLVVSLYMKIDQVMIKSMLGDFEVGQYAAAVKLSEVWYFIPVIISSTLFPAILKAKAASAKLYESRMQMLYDYLIWMAISIAIPMTFLSGFIVNLLYGSEFSQAAPVLMIHIWTSVFVFMGVASSKWFVAEGLQIYSFYRTFSGAVMNIMLNVILIPMYGVLGAAVASLIAQVVSSYAFNALSVKARPVFVSQSKAFIFPFRKLGGWS